MLLLAIALLAAEQVTILQGKSVVVSIPFVPATGMNANPLVVQGVVEPKAKRIVLFGKKPGFASYTIFDATKKKTHELDIEVIALDLEKTKHDLSAQLGELEGVTIRIAGDRVLVEGEVVTEAELDRVERLVRGRPDVSSFVRLSPVALKAIARTIEKEIHAAGLEGVTASAGVGESIDRVAAEIERRRADRIAEALAIEDVAALEAALAPFAEKRARAVREHLQGGDAKAGYAKAADGEWAALAKLGAKDKDAHEHVRAEFDATILDDL